MDIASERLVSLSAPGNEVFVYLIVSVIHALRSLLSNDTI